jgi:hypothetical protein
MLHLSRILRLAQASALGLLVCAAAGPAFGAAAEQTFRAFCSTWMNKLEDRETHNLQSAPAHKRGGEVVLQYTGYADEPLRCEAKRAASGKAVIGKLVYHERRYEKSGPTRSRALSDSPRVLEEVEVMEIFRHDGSQWVY